MFGLDASHTIRGVRVPSVRFAPGTRTTDLHRNLGFRIQDQGKVGTTVARPLGR